VSDVADIEQQAKLLVLEAAATQSGRTRQKDINST
jgi:hypothetical protein